MQENSTKDYKSQELDDLILQMAKAEQDESILKQENESLKEEIEKRSPKLDRNDWWKSIRNGNMNSEIKEAF